MLEEMRKDLFGDIFPDFGTQIARDNENALISTLPSALTAFNILPGCSTKNTKANKAIGAASKIYRKISFEPIELCPFLSGMVRVQSAFRVAYPMPPLAACCAYSMAHTRYRTMYSPLTTYRPQKYFLLAGQLDGVAV